MLKSINLKNGHQNQTTAAGSSDILTSHCDLDGMENIVHDRWELIDPTPDPQILSQKFNNYFFDNKLSDVKVFWSKRMTSCAGITYMRHDSIEIRLSEPILKFQARKAIIETLLHEMIHAYLCATNKPSGHTKEFKRMMKHINDLTGANITITHDFFKLHPEVYFFRCTGPCQYQAPDHGWLKRVENYPPKSREPFSLAHRKKCDGKFIRIYDTRKESENNTIANDPKTKALNATDAENNNNCVPSNKENLTKSDATFISGAGSLKTRPCSAHDMSLSIKQEISHEIGGDLDEIDLISNLDDEITDEMFANYHEIKQKLLSVAFLNIKPNSPADNDFCIICHKFVIDGQIVQHLFDCKRLSLDEIDYQLPFYRLNATTSK